MKPQGTPVTDAVSGRSVPPRALILTLLATAAAVAAAVFWPQALLDREILAGGLALIPAILLAYYRRWTAVSILLGLGFVALLLISVLQGHLSVSLPGSFVLLFVVAPYIAIALGVGWFGEVRRYQAELRATQMQLIQSEKLDSIGRIAAGVAHEVKNPLMTILTGVKLLSKRLGASDEGTQILLQDMSAAVARADRIIGGLLSYARNQELDATQADLNAIAERALLLVKHGVEKGRIVVRKDLDRLLPPLLLDAFKVEQVFVNLLTNALQAAGEGGEIHVRTSLETMRAGQKHVGRRSGDVYRPGERVAVVRIEDSGPGIPKQSLEKVFDPFFTTKPSGQGTGLGLSVSRQIIEMHGGTIDLANRDVGGAQATVTLKLGRWSTTDENKEDPARR
jgi:signal transduction histidine kinase